MAIMMPNLYNALKNKKIIDVKFATNELTMTLEDQSVLTVKGQYPKGVPNINTHLLELNVKLYKCEIEKNI